MHAAWSAAAAGNAAGARATECHARLEQLRDTTRATTEADVARAHEALLRAAFRAALAAERSAAARQGTTEVTLPRWVRDAELSDDIAASSPTIDEDEAGTYDQQYERMVLLGIGIDELWIHYVGLCGTYSQLEIEAYLHGAFEFNAPERARIDQALWELEDGR